MLALNNNPFQTYALDEHEQLSGAVLSPVQRAVIQNMRVEIITQKLSLTAVLTPEGKESYWQEEAYLRGQLQIIDHLLETSDHALTALQEQQNPQQELNPIP